MRAGGGLKLNMSRRLRLQVKPNIAGGPRLAPKQDSLPQSVEPQIISNAAEDNVSENSAAVYVENNVAQNEDDLPIAAESEIATTSTLVEENLPTISSPPPIISDDKLKSPTSATPVLSSLLSSPSKYRSRFVAKPNLNVSERRLTNFDESDNTGGPIVAASAIISQKVNKINFTLKLKGNFSDET